MMEQKVTFGVQELFSTQCYTEIFHFRANNVEELEIAILEAHITLGNEISDEARDLIIKILNSDPEKRLTIQEILNHPWIKSIDERDIIKINKYLVTLFTEEDVQTLKKEFDFNERLKTNL